MRQLPKLKKGFSLYPYQLQVVNWMCSRENSDPSKHKGINGGMVCLTMGLGKTLIALEHSIRAQKTNQEEYPTLIIASKTVMYEWKTQGIEKFYDNINVLYLHKDFTDVDKVTVRNIKKCNIVITTFDLCLTVSKAIGAHKLVCEYDDDKVVAINQRSHVTCNKSKVGAKNIYNIPWTRVICDESQRFANPTNYTYKAIMAIYGKHKWCLTGTPIRNYDTDVWSQLRFCGYTFIKTAKEWNRWDFKEQGLAKYMYEADYKKANITLVDKKVHKYYIDMDFNQHETYKALLLETQNSHKMMLNKTTSYATVLAMITRMRQICIAPHLILGQGSVSLGNTVAEEWIADELGPAGIDSPKIKKVLYVINKVPKKDKILIFSMFSTCLDLIKRALDIDLPNMKCECLTGRSNGEKRMKVLEQFKTGNVKVLLMHYKVGGEGLNLVEANHVIHMEPWWSPSVHKQGTSRCWRQGQTKIVHEHWILMRKTIEVPIIKLCARKQGLADYYLHDKNYVDPEKTGLTKPELQELITKA